MIQIHTKFVPPSVNACWRNATAKDHVRGRITTERYRTWQQAAGWDFNGKGRIEGPFTATIVIDRATRRASADLDNLIKPTLDMLQKHGVIQNDRFSERVAIEWGEADGGMTVTVEPCNPNAGRP